MNNITFNIAIPSDAEGYLGRVCRAPACKRYFKIQSRDVPQELHCPYCNTSAPTSESHTPEQLAHARAVGTEKIKKYAHDEIQKMLKDTFGGMARRNPSVFKFTPGPAYQEKRIPKRYKERTVDSYLCCPDCNFKFQVFGIFGFCPKCQMQNALIYDTNLAIIRKELAAAPDLKRALRHAYSDLVSTVEMFCKQKAPVEPGRSYQRLANVNDLATERTGKKLEELLSPAELYALNSVFQKRHISIHNGGIVDDRFARQLPGSEHLVGKAADLSMEEFEVAARTVQKLFAAIFLPPGR